MANYQILESYFIDKIKNLPSRPDTKAYITSTFLKYKTSKFDLSREVLILEYAKAKESNDFELYQNLGDWILFTKSIFPTFLNNCSEEYYYSIAQNSYYKCYVIVNKTWPVYEELADRLPTFIKYLNQNIF